MRRTFFFAAIALATACVATSANADPVRPFVGVRFGPQSWYFDRFDSPSGLRGGAVALEAGAFLTPNIGLYVFGERGFYDERDDRLPAGPVATSNALGLAARLRTPDDSWVAFVLDLGVAYRSLTVPYDAPTDPLSRTDTFSGLEWLRVRAGPTFDLGHHLWADVGLGVSIGRFGASARSPMTCAIVDGCPDSKVDDVTPSTHLLVDLVAGAHYAF